MGCTFKIESLSASGRSACAPPETEESLAEPSIIGPFPARVKGVDSRGGRFKVSTVLETLSAGYCDIRLEGSPEPGDFLSVITRINQAVVILRGHVLNLLPRGDGACSVAVRITRYRFVYRNPRAILN